MDHTYHIRAVFIGKEIHCASEKRQSETRTPRDIQVSGRGHIVQWSEKAFFTDSQL